MKFISESRQEIIDEMKPQRRATDFEFKVMIGGLALAAITGLGVAGYEVTHQDPACDMSSPTYDASTC